MKLGLIIGYWPSSGPPPDAAEQIAAAEDLGTATTLDHRSGGRLILGLGVSGPEHRQST